MSENDLVRCAKDGDRAALDRLITDCYPSIFAYFYKNTGLYHQSKDLTQEVFIKMASGLSRYRPRAPFKSWLMAIASNHLKNYYRSLSRRPEYTELTEDIPAGEKGMSRVEVRSDVGKALAHLPPEQREAVILRFYYDFSPEETAKITGAKVSTVKARIRYGLDKLKKELEGYSL